MKKRGGQTTFTQPVADFILRELEKDKTLRSICKTNPDLETGVSTVLKWAELNPTFNEQYKDVCFKGYHVIGGRDYRCRRWSIDRVCIRFCYEGYASSSVRFACIRMLTEIRHAAGNPRSDACNVLLTEMPMIFKQYE